MNDSRTGGPVDDSGLSIGAVLQAGLDAGLRVIGLPVSDLPFMDIGEARVWADAVRRFLPGARTRPEPETDRPWNETRG